MAPGLVEKLEIFRRRCGDVPVFVTPHGGGWRCEKLMARMVAEGKTAWTSQHHKGRAADIHVPGMRVEDMARIAEDVFADGGLGVYPNRGFIHVDVRPGRARWEVL